MHARIFIVPVLLAAGILGAGALLARAEASAPSSSSLAQQVAAQGKLIAALQSRVNDLEKEVSKGGHAQTSLLLVHKSPPKTVRSNIKVTDIKPGLATFSDQHAKFSKSLTVWHYVPIPIPVTVQPSTIQQLEAQQAQMAQQITALQQEVSVDETLLFGELTLVRNNINTLDNDLFTTYGNTDTIAWLACNDGGFNSHLFVGWTDLYGNSSPQCFQ